MGDGRRGVVGGHEEGPGSAACRPHDAAEPSHPISRPQFPLYWGVLKRSAKAAQRTLSHVGSSLSRMGSATMRRCEGGMGGQPRGEQAVGIRRCGAGACLLCVLARLPCLPPPRLPPYNPHAASA